MAVNFTPMTDSSTTQIEEVLLAAPRGFCAGVEMAIKALAWMVKLHDPPVYCYHEIVHNQAVVEVFERAGVIFVDEVSQVPVGSPLMLSAHGSAPEVVAEAVANGGFVVDAVCPLVTKVHHEVKVRAKKGFEIIYVGHEGHDEAIGTMAVAPDAIHLVETAADVEALQLESESAGVALLAQTTLSHFDWADILAAAEHDHPDLWLPGREDLCYATTNRQRAVRELAGQVDLLLVVGSANSSNTRALVAVARESGCRAAVRIDDVAGVTDELIADATIVGVTAGASAPESLVAEVIARLAPSKGVREIEVVAENEYFPLPPALREAMRDAEPPAPGAHDDRKWTASAALGALTARSDSSPPQPHPSLPRSPHQQPK